MARNQLRKANKEHTCWFCSGVIAKGAVYEFESYGYGHRKMHTDYATCERVLAERKAAQPPPRDA